MSQDWTDDVYDKDAYTAHVIMGNIELMFATLKSAFSGTSPPSNAVPGMIWFDTTGSAAALKMRNEDNNAWITLLDFENFQIFVDLIAEKSSGVGVTIDGVLLKDNDVEVGTGGQVKTGTIVEKVGAQGVTIDGCLVKDGLVSGVAANSVSQSSMLDSAIGQAELKETTAEDSSVIGNGSSGAVTFPGGDYGLVGVRTKATGGNPSSCYIRSPVQGSYGFLWGWFADGGGSGNHTAYVEQRYIQASGELLWIFIMRDIATKEILRRFCAPDHPCAMFKGHTPETYPHPWVLNTEENGDPAFNPAKHEIIVITLGSDEREVIRKLRVTGGRSRLEVIDQEYEIDDTVEPPWPSEPITIGLPDKWPEKKLGEKVVPIRKVIKKPKYIKTARLKRR